MSLRERSAWICLISIFIVFVPYFIYVLHVFERNGAISPPSPEGRIRVPTFSVTSQYVLFCFVDAEAVRYLTQVICYRREARV